MGDRVHQAKSGSFSERLMLLLDRVEYRRVESSEDMEDIARLRYKAYKAVNLMELTGARLLDELDFDSQAYVFGIYLDERLASTVRVHHVTPDHRASTSGIIFGAEINAFLDAGMVLIDPGRLAVDPDLLGDDFRALPYLTLRPVAMACEYFSADRCLTACRPRHAAFYKRIFQSETVVALRENLGVYNADGALLVAQVRGQRPSILDRYPIFDSEPFERRLMFAGREEVPFAPLTILPTARIAQGGYGKNFPRET
ncbi:N-acyl amino acid synthase FeeM domain-containing protein [Ensifer sp. LCM 4579]|uniref:N-acyl amino acid synthase FeeM domain-containing protein n=1 Tax=Ensifer sp. LCM 4579 TaxID=1848292 RepID=UPI0008D9F993|nr:hypothetical protein [Ensifer sp. LCM 4579]OHV75500.1 hypothetical protein LCM4579_08285 [Ensifer sp. LCM 4579]